MRAHNKDGGRVIERSTRALSGLGRSCLHRKRSLHQRPCSAVGSMPLDPETHASSVAAWPVPWTEPVWVPSIRRHGGHSACHGTKTLPRVDASTQLILFFPSLCTMLRPRNRENAPGLSTSCCPRRSFFFVTRTHVCLVRARSDGPDHADSRSTTYVSRVKKFTCRLQQWDIYLDSGFLSREYAAVRCRHALWADVKNKNATAGPEVPNDGTLKLQKSAPGIWQPIAAGPQSIDVCW